MRERVRSPGLLTDQNALKRSEIEWHRRLSNDIEIRLSAKTEFPCPFSIKVYSKDLLLFALVEGSSDEDMRRLAAGMAAYVDQARAWDGTISTARPLLIAFGPATARFTSPSEYDAFGWNVLQRLHELDPAPWPEGVSRDPGDATWSMCFKGMPIFCNMSHPGHRRRRSRNLGDHFVIVVNPRERFDAVAGDTPSGRKIRASIRSRVAAYDGVPHSSLLGSYGAGSLEWAQYSLPDDDDAGPAACPIRTAP